VPAATVGDPYSVDPTRVTGTALEGVTCDFCHKIWAVRLHPKSGLPFENMPGILSVEFWRPPKGHHSRAREPRRRVDQEGDACPS
jgi:hypothetical protein